VPFTQAADSSQSEDSDDGPADMSDHGNDEEAAAPDGPGQKRTNGRQKVNYRNLAKGRA
jgi:hypothetical protein